MKRRRIVVLGTVGAHPWAGMAWMHMQITAGLRRLGHDAYYFEVTSLWPYDPLRQTRVNDSRYALPFLKKLLSNFGLDDSWAYRRSYSDGEWFGLPRSQAEELLANADVILNISGATTAWEEGLKLGRMVYYGTDPGFPEIKYAQGGADIRAIVGYHQDCVTYGENIGTRCCPIPPLPNLRSRTRQPVLLDCWRNGPPARLSFTTVSNWRQTGNEVTFRGDTYFWSKHYEFLKFVELPRHVLRSLELAMDLAEPPEGDARRDEQVAAWGVPPEDRTLLTSKGWKLANSQSLSLDPWTAYRGYIRDSSGEFSVAKDLNVRLKTGWFSERSACYLAAGRPVITQDTGFGTVLPTGEGLFAYNTLDEAVAAFDAIQSDYERHSRAAYAIAEEYFKAETVMQKVLDDLGL